MHTNTYINTSIQIHIYAYLYIKTKIDIKISNNYFNLLTVTHLLKQVSTRFVANLNRRKKMKMTRNRKCQAKKIKTIKKTCYEYIEIMTMWSIQHTLLSLSL